MGRTHPQLQLPRPLIDHPKKLSRINEPTIQVSVTRFVDVTDAHYVIVSQNNYGRP